MNDINTDSDVSEFVKTLIRELPPWPIIDEAGVDTATLAAFSRAQQVVRIWGHDLPDAERALKIAQAEGRTDDITSFSQQIADLNRRAEDLRGTGRGS